MKKKLITFLKWYNYALSSKTIKTMKITLLLLTLGLSNIYASVFSQSLNIDLHLKNASLKESFESIEQKTNYKFLYRSDLVDINKTTSIETNGNTTLDLLLTKLLKNAQISYKIVTENLIVLTPLQPSMISGTVTDAITGESLPGVSITIEGTKSGTVSNSAGYFSLKLPSPNSVLVFSYLGYITKKEDVSGKSVLNISLKPDIKKLDEVIVVGYGTQKKSDVTGAISVISEKSLRKIPAANIASVLQGMGAGLDIQNNGGNNQPGSTPVIRIRGERSLSGGNDPLIVLDGIPYDGSLNDISPDDIVSTQVLKDASSTAIYGARGSNGVILINTSRGKEQKLTINYSGYVGFNKPLGKFDLMNGEQFALFKKWAKFNGSPTGAYTGIDDPKLVTDAFTDLTELAGYTKGVNTDWQSLMYKTSVNTNHQISLNGGTNKTKYAASLGYYNSTGVYDKQGMKRYSLKLSIDQQIGKYVKAGFNSLNSYTLLAGLDVNPMSQALQASPFLSPYNDDGTLRGFLGTSQTIWNPLADFVDDAFKDDNIRLSTFTTGYLDIDLPQGFKYKLNVGIQINPETEKKYYDKNTTKQLGLRSWGHDKTITGYNYTVENILTYDKTIAQKHNINFTGVYSLQEKKTEWYQTEFTDILSDQIGYYNPSLASNQTADGGFEKWDMLSYMGRLNYNYMEKYLFTFTVRSDGSSRLAEGKKWQTFPTGAIGWNIEREDFMKQLKIISALKLRASYGTVGSTAVSPYQTMGGLSGTKYNYGSINVLGYYPTDASNYNLVWEKTTSFNVGLDFGLLKNRITGSVEYYFQDTKDLLMDQALPATSGIPNKMKMNIGKTSNKGLEFTVNSVNLNGDGKDHFFWSSDINLYFTRQKIKQLASGATVDKNNNWFVGQPNNVFYDYKRIGIWQNTKADSALAASYGLTTQGSSSVIGTIKVADINNDHQINDLDKVILGHRQPDLEGGITNTFGFKNFDLSVVMNFKVGGMMSSDMYGGWMDTFQGVYNNLNVHYWTSSNGENFWPKPNSSQQNTQYKSTLCYFNAGYLKIRTMTLGYTVPASLLTRLGVQSARFYVTATNPVTLFSEFVNKYHGLDPETSSNVGINTPSMWSMLFGLNVTF